MFMGRARFLFARGFFFLLLLFFFASFVGDQTKTSARQVPVGTLNQATCNVYSAKAFDLLFSLLCVKKIFSFGFNEAFDSTTVDGAMGNSTTAIRGLQVMVRV